MYSYIQFDNGFEYIFKSGNFDFELFKKECKSTSLNNIDKGNNNFKEIFGITSNDEVEQLFYKNVFCFFSPDRYEKPSWMGSSLFDDMKSLYSLNAKYEHILNNSIFMKNSVKDNFSWLLDVIVDARLDYEIGIDNNYIIDKEKVPLSNYSYHLKKNLENLMSIVLGEGRYFGNKRFNIKRKKDNSIYSPSFDSLSTGQISLFNIFASIVRYAENNNAQKSGVFNEIVGIVVIEEIELHLHSFLQKEAVPKLIKLFPKVQFIITSHSPLFLMGMKSEYGASGFDIFQMPYGEKIDVEEFSEFERAYSYFENTELHNSKMLELIQHSNNEKALIVTEGCTDWKHMLAAYEAIIKYDDNYKSIKNCFEFFKYEPNPKKESNIYECEMGDKHLIKLCESSSKLPHKRKLIFIADRDNADTCKKMSENNEKNFKFWGNNVYSFVLPVPELRKHTPNICIEHYYSDEVIKTECKINGASKRLYIGNEFDDRGINDLLGIHCEKKSICGPNSICIIEGSNGERVTKLSDSRKNRENLALPKMEFANRILNKDSSFDNVNFENFKLIFDLIKMIMEA